MHRPRCVLSLVACLLAGLGGSRAADAAEPDPVAAAQAFLASLDVSRRGAVEQPFEAAARRQWEFRPGWRAGLPIGALDPRQHALAEALWQSGLGPEGQRRIGSVLLRERLLHAGLDEATRRRDPSWRHPGRYYLAVFGTPAADARWSWRLEGHHLSIHLTYEGATLVAATPAFLGGSPADARGDGGHVAAPTLSAWRALWAALDPGQRDRAFGGTRIPGDLEMQPSGARLAARGPGLRADALTAQQRDLLLALLATYPVGALAPDPWLPRTHDDLAEVRVFVRGDAQARGPHHLAIAGPSFAAEHCDIGQHLHMLWRTAADHGAAR